MQALINWLTGGITFPHLVAILVVAALLIAGIGPVTLLLPALFGLVGLAIPTGSSSSTKSSS